MPSEIDPYSYRIEGVAIDCVSCGGFLESRTFIAFLVLANYCGIVIIVRRSLTLSTGHFEVHFNIT
jgi:hypothetical protein